MTTPKAPATKLMLEAMRLLELGRPHDAAKMVVEMVQMGELKQPTMDLLTLLYQLPSLRPLAEQLLHGASAAHPQAALPVYTLARLLRQRNATGTAIEQLEEAIRRRPAFDEAHDLLQELQLACGRPAVDASVSVILPTTGHPFVRTALRSVLAQDQANLDIMLVADGPAAMDALRNTVPDLLDDPRVQLFPLPYNVGEGLWNGHRAFASMPALARGRFVAFLDQDNAWAPDHLSSLVHCIAHRCLQWASSLRVLADADGRVLGPDDCENIQPWKSVLGHRINDTSAYLVRTDIAVRAASVWYARYRDATSPDIALCHHLHEHFPRTASTGTYSLHYRIGRTDSVASSYFERGNAFQYAQHGTPPPWRRTPPPPPGTRMPGSA